MTARSGSSVLSVRRGTAMNRILAFSAIAAAMALSAAPAHAIKRTFVSATGDDADPCTATQPCLTFQATHNKTDSGGELSCRRDRWHLSSPEARYWRSRAARHMGAAGVLSCTLVSSATRRGCNEDVRTAVERESHRGGACPAA